VPRLLNCLGWARPRNSLHSLRMPTRPTLARWCGLRSTSTDRHSCPPFPMTFCVSFGPGANTSAREPREPRQPRRLVAPAAARAVLDDLPHAADVARRAHILLGPVWTFLRASTRASIFVTRAVSAGCMRTLHTASVDRRAASRSRVEVSDGFTLVTYAMDNPNRGLYLPSMIWVRLHDFAPVPSARAR
jgi:hypothetical protein